MKNIFVILMIFSGAFGLTSCSSVSIESENVDSDEPFELEELNKDEYQQLGRIKDSSETKFIRYDVAECNCNIMIPNNNSIKRIEHTGGGVSYVGFIDFGMYALTLTPFNSGVNSSSLDDIFKSDLKKARELKDKIILYSDFELHGFDLKEISTIINSKSIKSYSVQRIAVNDGLLHRIEFFGILHDDITYSYAEKFLNSLKKNI